jgi:hypothetical protein
VKGVTQMLDPEEEIAVKEFARFEEKLKQQKGGGLDAAATASAAPSASPSAATAGV